MGEKLDIYLILNQLVSINIAIIVHFRVHVVEFPIRKHQIPPICLHQAQKCIFIWLYLICKYRPKKNPLIFIS